jgi:hypothetical protein
MLEQIEQMIGAGTIGEKELSFVHVCDSKEEATAVLQEKLVDMWKERGGKGEHPDCGFLEQPIKGRNFRDRKKSDVKA